MPNEPSTQSAAEAMAVVGKDPTFMAPIGGHVVFEVMVATMWSVGELVAAEVERSRIAAATMGVQPKRGGSTFGTIAAGALSFTDLEFGRLSSAEERLAYAAAEWIGATSTYSDRRAQFLRGLKLRLRISDTDAAQLATLARSVDEEGETRREAFALLVERTLA